MTERYEKQIRTYRQSLDGVRKRFQLLGFVKFAVLFALIGAVYAVYRAEGESIAANLCALGLLAVLVVLWVHHIRVHEEVDRMEGVVRIAGEYLDRIGGKWTGFPDQGKEFLEEDHPYAADLDIVGPKSLFQLLCTARTWHGRRAFGADLLHPAYSPEQIRRRQEAVADLKDRTEFVSLLQYHGGKTGSKSDLLPVLEALSDPAQVIRSAPLRLALLWVPPLVTAALVVSLAWVPALYYPALIAAAAQMVFWLGGLRKTNRYLGDVMKAPYVFRHYAGMLELMKEEAFDAPLLKEMAEGLVGGDASAITALQSLDSIVSKVHVKNNPIVYFLLNVLLLWDYRCSIALSQWRRAYGGVCQSWFRELGTLESLVSLSGLPNVCTTTCLPRVTDGQRHIGAEQLGHPLLPNETRVCNDMAMESQLFIISGSNMSGKTTFLRTVGVGLVLAMTGGYVCADRMDCGRFQVMTSMRIADDLGDGISTFYAELRRIKAILDYGRQQGDLLFLIDEIFRGTNSEDRLFGAGAVIKELDSLGAMGLITTHDLSLCELETERPGICNYSFSEQYIEDDMHFDYRIRPGKSNTTNARFLMRQVGIL